jgi:diacylglycerol kinase (ATP)
VSPAAPAVTDAAVVIINPVSGPARRGSGSERIQLATRTLDKLGIRGGIRLTERSRHAHEIARDAVERGVGLVVAWGGDGTINEVACAVAHTSTSLGIVPGGSGNGLARELGVSFDPATALERALRSPDRVIDAGEVDGRMFFNMAGVGLDAHVAGLVALRMNHRGLIPYLLASARDLLKYRPVSYTIETDSDRFEASAVIVAFANSRQYGFGTRIAPLAVPDDGLLDLIVIEDRGLAGNLIRVPSVFLGRFDRQPGVTMLKVRCATVRSSGSMLFHVDGEAVEGGTELTARVHAGALRVRA